MQNTINGRTPEEIKKGLECCSPRYESKHWVTCSSECPFRNEGAYCRNVLLACNKKYIQQLERERDAAVKQLKKLSGTPCENCERCRYCKHFGKCDYHFGRCNDCISMDCPCIGCANASNWQWRGVEVEVE